MSRRRATCSSELTAGAATCMGLGLLVSACGVAGAGATTVLMQPGSRYQPASVTVPAGTEVVWANASSDVHTVSTDGGPVDAVRLPEGAEPWDSGPVRPGETYSRRLTVPGAYLFACRVHGEDGMVGLVRVER